MDDDIKDIIGTMSLKEFQSISDKLIQYSKNLRTKSENISNYIVVHHTKLHSG